MSDARFKKTFDPWTNVGVNPSHVLMFAVPLSYAHGRYVEAWFSFSVNNSAELGRRAGRGRLSRFAFQS